MNFLGLGPGELLLVMILALIVFGPGKLPEIGQGLGRAVREFRRATDSITQEFSKELSLDALTNPEPHQPAAPPPAAAPQPAQPPAAVEQTPAPGPEMPAPTSTAPTADAEPARPVLRRVRRAGATPSTGNGDGAPSVSPTSKIRQLRASTRRDQTAPNEGQATETEITPQEG
jgi:TatA/E family protein of Tat protein translocase